MRYLGAIGRNKVSPVIGSDGANTYSYNIKGVIPGGIGGGGAGPPPTSEITITLLEA